MSGRTDYNDFTDFIINWEPLSSLTNKGDLERFLRALYEKIDELSINKGTHIDKKNKGDNPNAKKIVTYCGGMHKVLLEVYKQPNSEFYIMSHTEMGDLLNTSIIYSAISKRLKKDEKYTGKTKDTRNFIMCNILGDDPQRYNLYSERSKYIKDYNGNEIEGLLTVFDYCSEKIVGANASENALFIGNETSGTDNVFVLTELPTLLNSSKVTMIDGIETSLFLSNRSFDSEADLVEIFNSLIEICNNAFSGITGSAEDEANIKNLSNKLDKISELKEISLYGINESTVLGINNKLDTIEAVDLYFTKRDFNELDCINAQNFGDTFYIAHSITEDDDNVRVYVNITKEMFLWILFLINLLVTKRTHLYQNII